MDPLEGVPVRVLGFKVKTRFQISFNFLVPCVVELLVYISLMTIDSAIVYQHFLDRHSLYAWITLGFILVPPVLTFICVMFSDQWPIEAGCGSEKWKFFGRQVANLLLFPVGAVYRFMRKIFWCVESLFHEKNSYERYHSLTKAAECSPFELYHFLQSFFHSAPQVILQLYIVLREDSFRNYDTAFVQALGVTFALIKMAMSVESFQRFESQKIVGRIYPWLAQHQIAFAGSKFRRTLSAPNETPGIKSDKVENFFSPNENFDDQRKTMNVGRNNFDIQKDMPSKEIKFVGNITDDDKISSTNVRDSYTNRPQSSRQNVPDDDLMENIEEIKEYLRRTHDDIDLESPRLRNSSQNFDRVPSLPPPPRPTSTKHPYLEKLHRISTFKDMLVFNAEKIIKENVPRIPEGMFEHPNPKEKEIKTENPVSPTSTNEDNEILLPTRKKIVGGIDSDDIVAKFISFLGWVMFLIMRMISLSVFSVFYLDVCGWICLSHYLLMLSWIFLQTRFKVKWQRNLFHFILGYIFIFNLMEFKIKFNNVRRWYVAYFTVVMLQNIGMTIAWYYFAVFANNWWFEFMFLVIVQSGIMSLLCLVLYFFYLKPSDRVFFVNEN